MLAQPTAIHQRSLQRECLRDIDPNSPFTSYPPFYATAAYPASTTSPSERNTRQQRYQPCSNVDSSNLTHCGVAPDIYPSSTLMPTSSSPFSSTSPQVRLQRPSGPAQISPAAVSSPMQAEHEHSLHNWLYYDNTISGGDFGDQHGLPGNQQKRLAERSGGAERRTNSPFSHAPSRSFNAQSESSAFTSGFDSSHEDRMTPADRAASFRFSKAPPTPSHTPSQESFLTPTYQNFNSDNQTSPLNIDVHFGVMRALELQPGLRDNHPPALSPTPQRHQAYSSAGRPSLSSIEFHSPATPQTSSGDDFDDGFRGPSCEERFPMVERMDEYLCFDDLSDYQPMMPKLERPVADLFPEDIYNTSYATSAPVVLSRQGNAQLSETNKLLSPSYRNVFSERIHAAQTAHQSHSPASSASRERSPFQQGSLYAPSPSNMGSERSSHIAFGSASHMREQIKAEADASELRRQMDHEYEGHLNTPKTISPKDTVLEYHGSEDDVSLFPSGDHTQHLATGSGSVGSSIPGDLEDGYTERSFGSMVGSRRPSLSGFSTSATGSGFAFAPLSVPGNVRVPQQYPFVPQRQQTSPDNQTPEFPAQLMSMESSASDAGGESQDVGAGKPQSAKADSGTYTCTYHGCTLRFETPAKLQKHKREGHRQINTHHPHSPGMTSAALMRNSQAGPHKCDRINPSTGKPCNTIFSRPYDLTRHEDTIHNARKQKVRCHLCTEDKSFSRNDALTRHMRVVHPEVEFGRSRRKHHD
jgi:protein RPN4